MAHFWVGRIWNQSQEIQINTGLWRFFRAEFYSPED